MAKIEPLSDIGASYASITTINANMDKITAAFDNTLSRDGSTPNSMQASLDMNSNKIINVLEPVSAGDVATKNYVDTLIGAVTGLVTPIAHTWAKLTDGTLTVDTYNNLRTLVGPGQNVTYSCRGALTRGDGGDADFYWDPTSTTTHNGVTVISLNSGGVGRFKMQAYESIKDACWGIKGDNSSNCTPGYNAFLAAAAAGVSPKTLLFTGAVGGAYLFSTKPNKIEDIAGIGFQGGGISRTTLLMGFSGVDKTEALLHFYGNSGGGFVRDFSIGTAAGGHKGGSLIFLQAKANSAPDAMALENLYLTSYSGVPDRAPTAGTAANPGVFTLVNHGFSVDTVVTVRVTLYDSGWYSLNYEPWVINSVPTADTFTLKNLSGTPLNTSSFSTFPTGFITIKEGACADVNILIDGSLRPTPAGVRNTKLNHIQAFGGRHAALEAIGAIELSAPGVTTSDGGWNGRVRLTGLSGIETYYAEFDGGTIAHLDEDYSIYYHGSAVIQGYHRTTANTLYSDPRGHKGGKAVDTSPVSNKNSSPSFVHHGKGIVTQNFAVTGITGSYATFSYPVAFRETPTFVVGTPTNSASTSANIVVNNIGKTSVELAGINLHASGSGLISVTGYL